MSETHPIADHRRAPRYAFWRLVVAPKPFDRVASLLYCGVCAFFVYSQAQAGDCRECAQPAWAVPSIVALTCALLLLDRAEYWWYGENTPPRLLALALLAGRFGLIEGVAQIDAFTLSPFLYLLIVFQAALYFGMRTGAGVAGVVWLLDMWKTVPDDLRFPPVRVHFFHDTFVYTLALIFTLTTVGMVIREHANRARAERLVATVEESHQKLQIYARQVGGMAATEERNRLAREIHDSLGHYLTVINVQLAKAQAFRGAQPEEADAAVATARSVTRAALRDVRQSVGLLRADRPVSFPAALPTLIAPLQTASYRIDSTIDGDPHLYPPQVHLVLVRVVQECLTNIHKHAHARQVRIRVTFGSTAVVVRVGDDGRGFTPGAPSAGFGVQGMRERVAEVGGDVRVESQRGQGTCVSVHIPRGGSLSLRGEPADVQERLGE